ncbi:phosphatase PAP2 family protein [Lampropedia puyangensis]|uniref:Phosphatase PAP2 family protein n=2 Tax=Lampropedia puyangensis TaxID=1330072 RepID=A0A4S8EQJ7_9BURK|nr:phosphatase PAP2 family protein [Lampropedia puyangensis]
MRLVSRLGNGIAWYFLIACIAISGSPQAMQASTLMSIAGMAGLVLYKWLKKTTSRPRPYARDGHIIALTAALDEFSFPSGHTLHAVAFTTVAVAFFPLLAWILVPFTALIALSRVVLGLHYPSDVLAGASIGATLAATILLWAA